jgi:hypothetical protein
MELWGAVAYAEREVLGKLDKTGDMNKALERADHLLVGSKVRVNWRSDAEHIQPTNVMAFIKAANEISPGTEAIYNFLCDSSHPSFMQHMALLFAGPEYDNWNNETFASEAVGILEKTIMAAESSIRYDPLSTRVRPSDLNKSPCVSRRVPCTTSPTSRSPCAR